MVKPECPPLNEGTTKSMRSNKGRGTKPELVVRKALREAGYPGYRLNWKKAPGHPDICYPGRRVAIFVNGCFWHRCPRCDLSTPEHNREYWEAKFEGNVERDRGDLESLKSDGWNVVVIWECELKDNLDGALSRAVSALEATELPRKRPEVQRSFIDRRTCNPSDPQYGSYPR